VCPKLGTGQWEVKCSKKEDQTCTRAQPAQDCTEKLIDDTVTIDGITTLRRKRDAGMVDPVLKQTLDNYWALRDKSPRVKVHCKPMPLGVGQSDFFSK